MKSKLIYILVAIFTIGLTLHAAKENDSQEKTDKDSLITTLTSGNYEKETSTGLVIVDVWAPWCGPCRKMAPDIKQLAEANKGVAKVAKLNAENYKKFAIGMGIESLPTIIVYKNGTEVERYVGRLTKEELQKLVDAHK